jgi:serine/threonine-protein kinase RsbT
VTIQKAETMPLRTTQDIVLVRQAVRQRTLAQGFSLVDQTKLVTAASEIARNTVEYGGGGEARLESLEQGIRRGVRIIFTDRGPGIADVQQALRDGFTTGNGLGLGLSGARRLCNEFEIESTPGKGTRVMIARWK